MGKRNYHPDHIVYGAPVTPGPAITGEALEALRDEMVAGMRAGNELNAGPQGAGWRRGEAVVEDSAARQDQTSNTLYDPETVVDAQEALEAARERTVEDANRARWAEADAANIVQGQVNDRHRKEMAAVTDRPLETDPLAGHTQAQRETVRLSQERAARRDAEQALLDAASEQARKSTSRETWPADKRIQTTEEAAAWAKHQDEARARADEARRTINGQDS